MKNFLILLIIWILFTPGLKAQDLKDEAVVKITGEVVTPMALKRADFENFSHVQVTRKDKDGKDHTYSGVILSAILQKAGVTLGRELRGKNLTKYVLIGASDGYQVVFALAELDVDFTDRTIILADMVDGKPLTPADGPFRIIVQDEKRPARCIKQVTSIKVQSAQ